MPPLSLLIKPASSLCNLRCRYCFYHSLSENRSVASYGLMNDTVVETIVRKALDEAKGFLTIAFQGGEPTLAGLEFFKKFVEKVHEFNRDKIKVQYALQTNGQLIDDEWAAFFARHHFLIGLSIDGYKALHDSLRVQPDGTGSFQRTLHAARLFEKHAIDFNVLTVVSERLARHPDKVYRFLTDNDFRYLQFIPCLAPLGRSSDEDPHAVSSDRYSSFLIRLFDRWYEDQLRGKYISIRLFDNYIQLLSGRQPEQCGLSGSCVCQMVIEADGGVYPCDFYVTDEWKLGSILDQSFASLAASEKAVQFIEQSRQHPAACQNCRWYPLCRNGCRRDRDLLSEELYGESRYCAAYQAFFQAAYPRLQQLATAYLSQQR